MTPAHATLVLLVVLLVFFPAVALLMRLVGTWIIGRDAVDATADNTAVASLSALEVGGFVSAAEVAALSPRERRFVAGAVGPRLANGDAALWAEPARSHSAAAETVTVDAPQPEPGPPADREVPLGPFLLVCPACGAALGATSDIAHYVGSCPGCARRVATRRRGARVSLTTAETINAPHRKPRWRQ